MIYLGWLFNPARNPRFSPGPRVLVLIVFLFIGCTDAFLSAPPLPHHRPLLFQHRPEGAVITSIRARATIFAYIHRGAPAPHNRCRCGRKPARDR